MQANRAPWCVKIAVPAERSVLRREALLWTLSQQVFGRSVDVGWSRGIRVSHAERSAR
jgi:hypothetical protein